MADAGKLVSSLDAPDSARLYKTQIPSRTLLANHNTICGPGKAARWMLAVYGKGQLSLAFYSGDREPALDGSELCGAYSYVTPKK